MTLTVHAGHNPDGKIACGAVGFVKESTMAREIKDEIVRLVKLTKVGIYDITVEDGTSQSNILTRLANNANRVKADLNLSIHLNAGANQKETDGKTTGVECWIYPRSKSREYAEKICDAISALGFKNRGVKENASYYILKKTAKPTIIVECCFVDDPDDCQILDTKAVARAIVGAILGYIPEDEPVKTEDQEAKAPGAESVSMTKNEVFYRVQVGSYRNKENAERLKADLIRAGFDGIIVRS